MKDKNPFSELIEESERLYEQAFTEGRKAGIKEVVEWIRSNEVWIHLESSMAWHSKLTEWSIE